ncbi:MAG: DUF4230 domain-containing protein [Bacillota bacterium]|nr:DUF4230 domain-containing protein [Bacillota bacterium]
MEKESKTKTEISKKASFKSVRKFVGSVFVLFLAVAVAFGLGFYTGIIKPWDKLEPSAITLEDKILENNYTLTISTIEKIIQPASDLITSKYRYKDADTYENFKIVFGKKVPFTTDMTVFTYEGVVSVGIDLLDVEYEIDNENQIISILIPELKILSNEIDDSSFKYPFKSDSIFNATDMSDFTELMSTLKENKEKIILNDKEFMDSARENAEVVLRGFLTASDTTKDFTVIFK